MLVNYESLSEEARVFIYPGSRKFYPNELPVIEEKMKDFCVSFEGAELSYEIKYDRFLVFIVSDDTHLDLDHQNTLVEFIQHLEREFEIILLDKVNVCFKQGEYVQLKEIPDFKKLVKSKGVSKKTVVFDLMINTKYEYEQFFEVPAEQSWVAHFF
jgi:hypothetical protein